MPSTDPGPVILCAGQYGSASTWLYNAVHALLADALGEDRVHRQFADSADALPARPDDRALVLKSHVPAASLRWLVARTGGKVVLTLRDPRDAAASLLHRFGFGYRLVAERVTKSGAMLPLLADSGLDPLVLRYEDGFSSRRATLDEIARFLGLAPDAARLDALFESLTPAAVRAEIARLEQAGAFGPEPTAHSHDSATHWHPGHVGDGAVGKFATVLTEGQVGDIIRRTRAYQDAFAYPMPPLAPAAAGRSMSVEEWGPGLAHLGPGFAEPDELGAWTEGEEARLHLAGATGMVELDLELPRRRGRAPPNPMRWSLWAEGGAAPLHGPIAATATPGRHAVTVPIKAGDLLLRFETLQPARLVGLHASHRLFGLRLKGFAVRA
jgi:hypothetical protein